ncbi:MAG: type II toxin-antitoxin system Phd/YefM family antitoxin [Caldilineaceae bacterium]|nr:type II toxin-antitoxin system Phd/YefM family antitoxin [Caldilineaceae bacterium]
MTKKYSIAEARQHFAALVHEVEDEEPVEITRRGEAVAVLLSMEAYQRIQRMLIPKQNFWTAYEQVRQAHQLADLDIEPEIFQVRSADPGRETPW